MILSAERDPRREGLPALLLRLRPATPEEALHALAPSTLYLLRADARLLHALQSLTRQLPAYWLETGTRLPSIPETITALLRP